MPEAWIGPAIIAAVIAAVINVVGWFTTARNERASDRRRRLERRHDMQTALRAEIQHYVDILSNPRFDLNESWSEVVGRMEADALYLPVVASERNDTVFRVILPELHILPEEMIQPVVRYYNQVFAIEAMIADLRADRYRQMSRQQQIEMYTDYISLKLEALEQGRHALDALSGRVSSPGAARSDQQ